MLCWLTNIFGVFSLFLKRQPYICAFILGSKLEKLFELQWVQERAYLSKHSYTYSGKPNSCPKYCLPFHRQTGCLLLIVQWSFNSMVNKTCQACVILLAATSLLLNTSSRTWFEIQSSEVLPPMADMLLRATDVSLMKGFCCANMMLSVLPQMDAFCVGANTITRRNSMELAILWSLEHELLRFFLACTPKG